VDDEKTAREGVNMLAQQDSELEVAAVCKNGLEAIKEIHSQQPDLIFLDVQMPSINGFEVLNSLSVPKMPAVIFITAYDQYSLKAFEVNAVDYLLKPFTDERFFDAVQRAKQQIRNDELSQINQSLEKLISHYQSNTTNSKESNIIPEAGQSNKIINNRLVIKSDGKIYFLPLNEIVWVQAYDYYIRIHTKSKFYLVRDSMKKMEAILPSEKFIRIHKSSIINIEHILELEPYFNGEYMVSMSNNEKLKISRSYRDNLKGILDL